jgi:hypothetical protein
MDYISRRCHCWRQSCCLHLHSSRVGALVTVRCIQRIRKDFESLSATRLVAAIGRICHRPIPVPSSLRRCPSCVWCPCLPLSAILIYPLMLCIFYRFMLGSIDRYLLLRYGSDFRNSRSLFSAPDRIRTLSFLFLLDFSISDLLMLRACCACNNSRLCVVASLLLKM